jgi:hypothetical protein
MVLNLHGTLGGGGVDVKQSTATFDVVTPGNVTTIVQSQLGMSYDTI